MYNYSYDYYQGYYPVLASWNKPFSLRLESSLLQLGPCEWESILESLSEYHRIERLWIKAFCREY